MIILIIHIIVYYDQNISLIFYVKMDSMSGCDIRPVFTFPPKDSTLQYKNAYTSEITFHALSPWGCVSCYNSRILSIIHVIGSGLRILEYLPLNNWVKLKKHLLRNYSAILEIIYSKFYWTTSYSARCLMWIKKNVEKNIGIFFFIFASYC